MSSTSRHTGDQPPPFSVSVRCRACSRAVDVTTDDVFRFITAAWPECCGEAMALRVRLAWPGSAAGAVEPGRWPGHPVAGSHDHSSPASPPGGPRGGPTPDVRHDPRTRPGGFPG